MDLPTELSLELLMAADYLDGEITYPVINHALLLISPSVNYVDFCV